MAPKHRKNPCRAFPLFAFVLQLLVFLSAAETNDDGEYVSGVGDPGMRRDGLRLAIESWNQCNEVGEEVPQMGSPRAADCFDIYKASAPPAKGELPHSSLCFCSLLMYKEIATLFFFISFLCSWDIQKLFRFEIVELH